MLTCLIRNFFVMLVSVYTFYKLLNIKPKKRNMQFFLVIYSFSVSLCTALLFSYNQSLNWLFILVSLFLIVKCIEHTNLYISYNAVLFSFSLSFTTFSLSAIIVGLILIPIFYGKYEMPWILIRLLIGSIHTFLIFSCFRIPRLRKGMKFLHYIPSYNLGLVSCISLFMLFIMFCELKTRAETYIYFFMSLSLFLGFLLICWWNYHITQTYRKFLRKNEINSLNLLLEERNQEILYLKSENDKLARIIHKDNKIIPALSMAIIDSYENKTTLNLSVLETTSSLHRKLKQLYKERVETLANYQQEILRLPQTAFDSVNAVLSYMQTESLKAGIPFHVMLFDDLASSIPEEITEDDFTHVLSDLLSNAINACKDIPSASIQVYLGSMENIPTIKVLNMGNVFDAEVLRDLGLARHTTHADTGGSGIGLMDIWSIKERYRATLLIDEIANDSNTYTCVNILFNHKKHYIIQSNRHKELSSYINRPDIMIISKD